MWSPDIKSTAGNNKINEDFADWKQFHSGALLAVVADGMGNLPMGDKAAKLAVNTICEYFNDNEVNDGHLITSINKACNAIFLECMKCRCRMGCAIAIVYVDDKNGKFISMGNVHISVLKTSGEETLLSEDNIYTASNGNKFLSQFLSDREIIDLPIVYTFSIDDVLEIKIATDGEFNRDIEDDATIVRISRK